MNLTPRLDEAIKLASQLHRDQTRKDAERTPYISHLISVATIIGNETDDEDVIIAGLMHDSVEDVEGYTHEKLISDHGERIASIVKGVTEIKERSLDFDREVRWLKTRERYLETLKSAPVESSIVSAADKIHNIETFLRDYKKEGESFVKKFDASVKNNLWFYESVLKIVEKKLGVDNNLSKRLSACISEFKDLVENYER